jgi:protein TonB
VNLRSFSTLQIALGVSLAVHAVLLTVRFVDPEGFNKVFQDTPLEVILVNTKTNERPDKAAAIAQTSLAGGGEAAKGRATSPLPPSAFTRLGDAAEDAEQQSQVMLLQQQAVLLAEKRREINAMPPPDPQSASRSEILAFEKKRKHQLAILGEIERRVQEENAKPHKRYVTPSTREEAFAVYYDVFRRKIEDKGTRNFPSWNGKPVYGELVMQITVNFDGQISETLVEHSSGVPLLDRRAQQIAANAGPFGAVPPKVQARLLGSGFNRLAFIQTFTFAPDGTLSTTLMSR